MDKKKIGAGGLLLAVMIAVMYLPEGDIPRVDSYGSLDNTVLIYKPENTSYTNASAIPLNVSIEIGVLRDVNVSGKVEGSSVFCYQESANVSTVCGGLDTGSYEFVGDWHSPENVIDGNWNNGGYNLGAYVRINYTKPSNSNNLSLWMVKSGDVVISNVSILDSCWGYDEDTLFLVAQGTGSFIIQWFCYDGDYNEIFETHTGSRLLYEEGMWWNINEDGFSEDIIYYSNDTVLYMDFEEYAEAPTVNGSGTLAQYHLDLNALDGSGNGYDGVVTDATPTTTGCKYDGCYSFDGINDYIKISDEPTSTWSKSICDNGCSFCTWAQVEFGTKIMGRWDAGGDNEFFRMYTLTSNKFVMHIDDDGDWSSGYSQAVFDEVPELNYTLAHICGVFNGTTSVAGYSQIFINGVGGEIASTSITINGTAWDDDEDFFLGACDDGAPTNNPLHGVLDEVLIYDRPITADEVKQLYMGSSVIDHSNSENTGSIIGAYNASGKYGSGMHFDVENSNYILLADESAGEDQYKTFCDNGCSYGGWMKVDDDLINMVMMSKYLNSGTQRFFYISWIATSGLITGYLANGNSLVRSVAQSAVDPLDWHQVYVVYNGTASIDGNSGAAEEIILYIDGEFADLGDVAISMNQTAWQDVDIDVVLGASNQGISSFMNGTLDNIELIKRTLSASEIKNKYLSDLRWHNDTYWTLEGNLSLNESGLLNDGELNVTVVACNTTADCTTDRRLITIGAAIGVGDTNMTVYDGSIYSETASPAWRCTPTQTNCVPTNQDETYGIFLGINNGTETGDLKVSLDAVCTNIAFECDDDNTVAGATTLSTSAQTIHASLVSSGEQKIWCWADYTSPDTGCLPEFEMSIE